MLEIRNNYATSTERITQWQCFNLNNFRLNLSLKQIFIAVIILHKIHWTDNAMNSNSLMQTQHTISIIAYKNHLMQHRERQSKYFSIHNNEKKNIYWKELCHAHFVLRNKMNRKKERKD